MRGAALTKFELKMHRSVSGTKCFWNTMLNCGEILWPPPSTYNSPVTIEFVIKPKATLLAQSPLLSLQAKRSSLLFAFPASTLAIHGVFCARGPEGDGLRK